MYNSKLKFLPILLLGILPIKQAQSMERESNYRTAINNISSTMGRALNKSAKKTNTVFSPLGIPQTLASLSLILNDEGPKEEIKNFTGDPKLSQNMGGLNKLISKNLIATEKGKIFTLNNGLYAFFSDTLKIPKPISKEFEKLGSKIESIDFSKSQDAANRINSIVREDTQEKIKEIANADNFDKSTISVFLHTLYLKSEWLLNNGAKNKLSYTDINGDIYNVTSFEFKNQYVKLLQDGNVSLIALPMAGNSHIIIRHNRKDSGDIKYISENEIKDLIDSDKYQVNFEAPFVSMAETLDLKELLKKDMPQIFDGTFQTNLGAPATISKYIQMLTFDMNDKGAEASAVTMMSGKKSTNQNPDRPIDIKINSSFTLVWVKEMEGKQYILFQAQIVDTKVMKDVVLIEKNSNGEDDSACRCIVS